MVVEDHCYLAFQGSGALAASRMGSTSAILFTSDIMLLLTAYIKLHEI